MPVRNPRRSTLFHKRLRRWKNYRQCTLEITPCATVEGTMDIHIGETIKQRGRRMSLKKKKLQRAERKLVPLQLIPAILSLLLLGAHFFRSGANYMLPLIIVLLALLLIRKPWAARVVQGALTLGTLEWIRTLVHLSNMRIESGQPFLRLVVILGIVTAATFFSALAFQSKGLSRVYGLRKAGRNVTSNPNIA
jgi:hypothetical protein